MEGLILEYISELCEIKGNATIFFDGRRIYHKILNKHLSTLFDLCENEIDGYLVSCFYDMDNDFDYSIFMSSLAPSIPSGLLYYMDYVNVPLHVNVIDGGDFEPRRNIASRYAAREVNDRFYCGIDPAMGRDAQITVTRYGELDHENRQTYHHVFDAARAVMSQSFNLDLTPLGEDLEE